MDWRRWSRVAIASLAFAGALVLAPAQAQSPAGAKLDLLDLQAGAVVHSATGEYGEIWSALEALSGRLRHRAAAALRPPLPGPRHDRRAENLIGHVRRVARNVKRWKGDMRRRWTWLAIADAAQRFRRISSALP